MATYLVLTIIGDDKPGLVGLLSETISRHSGNWLESNMSHLAGKFAGILRVSVGDDEADALVADLQGLSSVLKLVVEIKGYRGEDAKEKKSTMDTYWVPGCFEIPQTVSWLLEQGGYDGVLALGCLIRGETDHYDYLATEVTRGLGSLSTVSEIPVCYGILTCDNLEQALHRAGSKSGNKGAESMQALIEMINLTAVIGGEVEDVVEDGEES